MRNLKKILALVLAMVMTFSVMATANAALTDLDTVDADYEEAVAVLTGMGVFKGRTAADGSTYFAPKASITREEVAAIIYRIVSGDVTDAQDSLYVEGAKFSDVKATSWSAGYIGYCAIGELVLGYNGKFNPTDEVTGYQVLAMALRAIGYDQNGEFTGDDWYTKVATTAEVLGILENVDESVQLSKPASRELVAELIFQTIAKADQVEYTNAFGYQPVKFYFGQTATLGADQFELTSAPTQDDWGRPGTEWTYNVGDKTTTILDTPTATYTTAVTECQVSTDTKVTTSKTYTTYTNGKVNAGTDTIVATNTDVTIGAQGRITEVYKAQGVIVYIDTLLAKVDAVAPATYDAVGHLKTNSSITLTIYDGNANSTQVTLTNGKTNYAYAKNDMVLVQAVQTNLSVVRTDAYQHVEILGVAEAFTGAQTFVHWFADKHTVNGTEYMDNVRFHLDAAGITLGTNYTWYMDQFGNLIGDTVIVTPKAYAVVENVQWLNTWGVNGYAQANIRYMDNTTATVIIKDVTPVAGVKTAMTYADYTAINIAGGDDFKAGKISTVWQYNDDCMKDLYEVVENTDGTVSLTEQAEVMGADVKDGVSAITDGTNAQFYTDNYTVYMIQTQNKVTGAYTYEVVTGYDNLEKNWTGADVEVDYVLNSAAAGGFAKYVYITGTADQAAAKAATEFVYFTSLTNYYGDAMENKVPCFVIGGVVDAEGNTDVIYVAKTAGSADPTSATAATTTMTELATLLAGAQNKLYMVTTNGGIVTDLDQIVAVNTTMAEDFISVNGTRATYAHYILNDDLSTIDGNGVLKTFVKGTNNVYRAYNVNAATTIINEGGKGTITDLNNAVLAGKNIYVVGACDKNGAITTQALAIFITSHDATSGVNVATVKNAAELAAAVAAKKSTIIIAGDITLADDTYFTFDYPVAIYGKTGAEKITAKSTTDYAGGVFNFFAGSEGSSVSNLTINFTATGRDNAAINFQGYAGTAATKAVVKNVTFKGAANINAIGQEIGILADGSANAYVEITGCSFTNFKYAMYLNKMNNLVFSNNVVDGTNYAAVIVANGDNVNVTNNTLTFISAANYNNDIYASGIVIGSESIVRYYDVTGNTINMLNGKADTCINGTASV